MEPSAQAERAATPEPELLCREIHQIPVDVGGFWIDITVTTSPMLSGQEARKWPFPKHADWGRQVADLIRTDCG